MASKRPGTFLEELIPPVAVCALFQVFLSQIEHDEVRSHVLGTHFLHIFHILESIDKDYWG
ncbi:hypothetical protein SPYJRS4_0814 [Streptococcus pyogenes JRS4]|nr:hypothetical protein SPYJRS4_0814 [Streptococcus pyogenes JRS4]